MTIKEIKIATLGQLYYASGKAQLAQGNGANYSKMLDNRINAIEKEIRKRESTVYFPDKK